MARWRIYDCESKMKCNKCGAKLKQLLTSWYCPSCPAGDNSDVKEKILDSALKVEWTLLGTIGYIHSHPYGYVIHYIDAHTIYSSLFPYDSLDVKSQGFAKQLAKHGKKGFTLYYHSIDKKYGIWSPGFYWDNGEWKYFA